MITRAGITGSEHSARLVQLLQENFPAPMFVIKRKNCKDRHYFVDRAFIASVYRADGSIAVQVPKWEFRCCFWTFRSREMISQEMILETHIATVTLGVVVQAGVDSPQVCSPKGVFISGWNSFVMGSGAETAVA